MNHKYLIFVIVPALGLVILKLLVFKKKTQLEQTDQRKLKVQSKQDVTILQGHSPILGLFPVRMLKFRLCCH